MTDNSDPPDKPDSPDSQESEEEKARLGPLIAGRYQILDRLGTGGAGVVFKAADRQHGDAIVALKILTPMDFQDPTARIRFEKEISLTHGFRHENLVQVYEFGQTETGQNYITMECIEGGTLTGLIRDKIKPLDFGTTLRILRDVAQGAAFAHSHGIVHRDLKPDNILITRSGVAKVADFGLARQMDAGFTITRSADTVGTPYYMAPEQFKSHRVDERADIYSLGIMAYEMVTGKRPFVDEAYQDIALSHLTKPVPTFVTRKSGIPQWFGAFVGVCTEKTPDNRYDSMDQIVRLLEKRMRKMGLIEGRARENDPWWIRVVGKLLGLG